MDASQLLELINQGETLTTEFKSWVKIPDFKKLIKFMCERNCSFIKL